MSGKAVEWAWEVTGISLVQKLVLVALADHENAKTHECKPGTARLVRRLCISERALRNAIIGLETAGLISRDVIEGIGTHYTLNTQPRHQMPGSAGVQPRHDVPDTHARDAGAKTDQPRHMRPNTPAPRAAEPLENHINNNRTPLVPQQRHLALAVDAGANPRLGVGPKRHRLPPLWQPDADDRRYACERQLDPDALLLDFRAHFDNAPDSRAMKNNWSQAWQWWCRNELKFYGAKGGIARKPTQAEQAAEIVRAAKQARADRERTIDGHAERVQPMALGGHWSR